jgi:hypothetical protein
MNESWEKNERHHQEESSISVTLIVPKRKVIVKIDRFVTGVMGHSNLRASPKSAAS